MICPNCGNVSEGERTCAKCGAGLSPPVAPIAPAPGEMASPVADSQPSGSGDLTGRTLDQKYYLESKLGAGGKGTVYRARRLQIGDRVVVKVLHPDQVADPKAIERFRHEAQTAASLKHPNILTIYDFGVSSEGLSYLVMESSEGENLRHLIDRQGKLTETEAVDIIRQVCAALDEAHRHNVVHRSIKPDNILAQTLPGGVQVKVLDFGISSLRNVTASRLTRTGSVVGTPHYMSPEHCLGEELDGRSDIYSLGIVLFEMLTGVVPFASSIPTAIVVKQIYEPPPRPRDLNPSISPDVESVVLRVLEKWRDARPQTAGEMARELIGAVNSAGEVPAPESISHVPITAPKLDGVPPNPVTAPTLELIPLPPPAPAPEVIPPPPPAPKPEVIRSAPITTRKPENISPAPPAPKPNSIRPAVKTARKPEGIPPAPPAPKPDSIRPAAKTARKPEGGPPAPVTIPASVEAATTGSGKNVKLLDVIPVFGKKSAKTRRSGKFALPVFGALLLLIGGGGFWLYLKKDRGEKATSTNTSANSSQRTSNVRSQPVVPDRQPTVSPTKSPPASDKFWGVISSQTSGVTDAVNALGSANQQMAVIHAGGQLALEYRESRFFSNGLGSDLQVYGPEQERVSYLIFVRNDPAEEWKRIDINRKGFTRGEAGHDMGHHGVQQARQVMIRNTGNADLRIDAILIVYKN